MLSALSPVNLFANDVGKEFLSEANKHTDMCGPVSVFHQAGKDGTPSEKFQDIHLSLKNRFK